jgi:hypothetical protein
MPLSVNPAVLRSTLFAAMIFKAHASSATVAGAPRVGLGAGWGPGRSKAEFFLPAESGGVTYRLHVDRADRRVANPARVRYYAEVFRWVDDEACFSVEASAAWHATLQFVVEPGPSLAGSPLTLTVTQNGHALRTLRLEGRTTVSLPAALSAANNEFAQTTPAGAARVPGDPRTLDFRVLSLQVR